MDTDSVHIGLSDETDLVKKFRNKYCKEKYIHSFCLMNFIKNLELFKAKLVRKK